MNASFSGDALERLKQALFQGNKIEAIKIYRGATDSSLKDAKDEVEKFEKELRSIAPDQFKVAEGRVGCAALLVPAFGLVAWWSM